LTESLSSSYKKLKTAVPTALAFARFVAGFERKTYPSTVA